MLDPGRNIWRVERARRASLIVDAATYFEHALAAMLAARSQIFLIGWDLDTRVSLASEPPEPGVPTTLGPLLSWLATSRPALAIRVIVWDQGLISVPGRGTTALRLLKWAWDGVSLKWDSSHPLEGSQHQKVLVVDDSVAFCGGIDITAERWDTRRHKDDDPGRRRPFTKRAYGPWHDATMAVDGDAAAALGDFARNRWEAATGTRLGPANERGERWPKKLEPQFADIPVGIARTLAKMDGQEEVREIEALFADMIRAARRRIYFEAQYFASRVVARALCERLEEKHPPEVVVVNPRTGENWLDDSVMSAARFHLLEAVGKSDRNDRFRIYSPVTKGSADIYVHAKIMIVDDTYLRVGSANLNNRSMGLDTECDLVIDASDDPKAQATIAAIQCDLLAEHLGVDSRVVEAAIESEGGLIGAIEKLRGSGRTVWPLHPPRPGKVRSELVLSEIVDPERKGDAFEPVAGHRLLRGLRARFS